MRKPITLCVTEDDLSDIKRLEGDFEVPIEFEYHVVLNNLNTPATPNGQEAPCGTCGNSVRSVQVAPTIPKKN